MYNQFWWDANGPLMQFGASEGKNPDLAPIETLWDYIVSIAQNVRNQPNMVGPQPILYQGISRRHPVLGLTRIKCNGVKGYEGPDVWECFVGRLMSCGSKDPWIHADIENGRLTYHCNVIYPITDTKECKVAIQMLLLQKTQLI